MIYLDSAATSLQKPPCVAEAVAYAVNHMASVSRGAYAAALDSARIVYETRSLLAELFGASSPEQVAFTMNSTMALNIAIRGSFVPGDHIITTAMEHNSVLRPLYDLEKQGVTLTILPCDAKGCISYEQMEESIQPNTKGIVCTHVSNVTGNVNDIKKIAEICQCHSLRLILDASQSAGLFPIMKM
ncbi:MAG: aminotransferase class V-fold PLP-dependent enzyme [Lachnospiraceae bacterium]